MRRGNFYTEKREKSDYTIYDIWLRITKPISVPFNHEGRLIIAGFLYEEERDRYFNEFTDSELTELEDLSYRLWEATDLKVRMKISSMKDRLLNTVQKRTGIKDT